MTYFSLNLVYGLSSKNQISYFLTLSIGSSSWKLKPREGGRVPEGERESLPGTVTPGFLMSFLNSMVINWQVMTLWRNYW